MITGKISDFLFLSQNETQTEERMVGSALSPSIEGFDGKGSKW